MTSARDRPQAQPIDRSRLNDAEREALDLLAEGHTAKSIASLTGRSVAAINERLREARRKTGISSSRELARLLKAQKSWDEEMGMAATTAGGASMAVETAPLRAGGAGRKGLIAMAVLAIGGIAAALLLQAAPQTTTEVAPSNAKDPLLGGMFQREELHPRRLYGRVRTESRDAAWADRAEAAIKARYARLSGSGRITGLRVICASTVCEAAGSIVDKGDISVTMREIQDDELDKLMAGTGLTRQAASFGPGPNTDQGVFATYWLRSGR